MNSVESHRYELPSRLALPVPQISLAGLVNHPNSSRSSKAKAMATSWV